jgi:glycosyltransferase involved in cell wall biosynthesis
VTPLHLVVCCDAFLPADQEGGPPFSTFNLCRALSDAGADVRVITTNRNGTEKLDVPTDRWTQFDGVPVWYARSFPGPYYPAPSARRALASAAPPDCILSSGTLWTHLGFVAWRAGRRYRTPVIMFPRGLLDPWALAFKAVRKRLYWNLLGRRILRDAAITVALTENERETVRSLQATRRIEVIPNGIRVEDFSNPPPRSDLEEWLPQLRDTPFVLYLGRIHEKKGLPALVGAVSLPVLAHCDFQVVIAGPVDQEYRSRFDQVLESCPCRRRLLLTGPVSGPLKSALLAHAAAFVIPSVSEGLPVAVLEALASACPTILTPGCNLPEVAAAGAGIEVASDRAQIATALEQLLCDATLRHEMGQRGLRLASARFDWRFIGRQMLTLCGDVSRKDAENSILL